MKSYEEIEDFSAYYLEDSFILGVGEAPRELSIEMDVVLTPEHPQYTPNHPGEQHCYRRGFLKFSGVEDLEWRRQEIALSADAPGEIDYGNIHSWSIQEHGQKQQHLIRGDIGELFFSASSARIVLEAGE